MPLICLLVVQLFLKRFDEGAKPASIAANQSRVLILLCFKHGNIFNFYIKDFNWHVWQRHNSPEDFNIRKFT